MSGPSMARKSDDDLYANLLADTRGWSAETAAARAAWFSGLALEGKPEHKAEALAEFELLLKGLAHFGEDLFESDKFFPIPPPSEDAKRETAIFREGLLRTAALRVELEKGSRAEAGASELDGALWDLGASLGRFVAIADGLLRAESVTRAAFEALRETLARDLERAEFLGRLEELEFCPEYDGIPWVEAKEALLLTAETPAHRNVALALLTLFRAMKYVSSIRRCAEDDETLPRAHLWLAVLCADLESFTRFVTSRAGGVMADGFEREILESAATSIGGRIEGWRSAAISLGSIQIAFERIAIGTRRTARKMLEHNVPAPSRAIEPAELRASLSVACAELDRELVSMVHAILNAVDPEQSALFATARASGMYTAYALRRDAWTFAYIVRAFLAKAEASGADADGWTASRDLAFARDFASHVRTTGYEVARLTAYPELDALRAACEAVRGADFLDRGHLDRLRAACDAWLPYLESSVAKLDALLGKDAPFDRREAKATLRFHLAARAAFAKESEAVRFQF